MRRPHPLRRSREPTKREENDVLELENRFEKTKTWGRIQEHVSRDSASRLDFRRISLKAVMILHNGLPNVQIMIEH